MHYPAAYPAEIKKSTQLTPPHYPVPEILLVTVKISCYLLRYFEFNRSILVSPIGDTFLPAQSSFATTH